MNGKTFGILGLAFGIVSLAVSHYTSTRIDSVCDSLAKGISIDIPEDLVNKAVEKAVDREVGAAIERATKTVTDGIESTIKKDVRNAIEDARNTIDESVATEIKRQVKNIDIQRLKNRVVEEAKEAAIEKLDGSLDDILDRFKDNLDRVSKIRASVIESMCSRPKTSDWFNFD